MPDPAHRRDVDPRRRAITLAALGAVGLLVVVVGFVVTGSDAGSVSDGAATPIAADPPAATATSPATAARRLGSGQAVTFAFGGDIHFEKRIAQVLDTNPGAVLAGVRPVLAAADVAMANLETAITTRGTPAPGKEFTFRAPPQAFTALAAGGLDVVSVANNHGLDYGPVGLTDTLAAAHAAGFPVVGIGNNAAEAFAPWTTTVKGQRIAVFGVTHVLDDNLRSAWTATDARPGLASAYETDRLVAAIRTARAEADTVVVYIHWGTEGQTCPNGAQPGMARTLVGAGADIVVGGHAHRLQGAGRMGEAFVAYGLVNFVFYQDSGPATDTGVLTVTATGTRIDSAAWHPAKLVGQLPRTLQGTAATAATTAWNGLKACTGLS
jgi:poly-gamma-glutamate capsule biosynthesis protein CapA/YwtB (metallophosphatase superfamily)